MSDVKWTLNEESTLREFYRGRITPILLARLPGRTRNGVYHKAESMGLVRKRKHGGSVKKTYASKVLDDGEKRLTEIPQDDRDLTGKLMGDPLPGRSALDMR